MIRLHIDIHGIVQGVGFRPFVHRLVGQYGLTGWVRNSSEGAELELEGAEEALEGFLSALRESAPPLALIESVDFYKYFLYAIFVACFIICRLK